MYYKWNDVLPIDKGVATFPCPCESRLYKVLYNMACIIHYIEIFFLLRSSIIYIYLLATSNYVVENFNANVKLVSTTCANVYVNAIFGMKQNFLLFIAQRPSMPKLIMKPENYSNH